MDDKELRPLVLVATMWHESKAHCVDRVMGRLAQLKDDNYRLYANIEGTESRMDWEHRVFLSSHYFDKWGYSSSWRMSRRFDQDNPSRVPPICTARNMAIDCAMSIGAEWLLYVDADVVIPANSIEELLALKQPLCGGVVPGRGAHSHVNYTFGPKSIDIDGKSYGGRSSYRCQGVPVVISDHGTAGFMMVHRSIFDVVRFRYGHSQLFWERPAPYLEMMAEDACFAEDAEKLGLSNGWHIHTGLVAEHLDDPGNPLTEAGAINTYDIVDTSQPKV